MIDATSLRNLGWSEDLIAEVTRDASQLRAMVVDSGLVPDLPSGAMTFSNSSVSFDAEGIWNSSTQGLVLNG